MTKVLFIPNSMNQLNKFLAVAGNFDESFQYSIINLDKFKNSNTLSFLRKNKIPHIILEDMTDSGVRKLLKDLKPDILIVGNDTEALSYLFVQTGHQLGIKSLLVQDGILAFSPKKRPMDLEGIINILTFHSIEFLLRRVIRKIKNSPRAHLHEYGSHVDFVAVWGDKTKNDLIGLGIGEDKVIVTGSPSMDALLKKSHNLRPALNEVGADPSKKTIFYATSDLIGARLWTRSQFDKTLQSIVNSVKNMENVQMIIKQHPFHFAREPNYLHKFIDNKKIFSGNEIDTHDLIWSCDTLLTDVSTCASEAIVLDKPVGIVNLLGIPFVSKVVPQIYINSKVGILLNDERTITEKLNLLLYDEKTKSSFKKNRNGFIADNFYKLDGKSGQRIADLIKKICP